eukprot:2109257-Pleurochrysis_carterae.AAC.1
MPGKSSLSGARTLARRSPASVFWSAALRQSASCSLTEHGGSLVLTLSAPSPSRSGAGKVATLLLVQK